MKTHEFTIIATGLDPFAKDFADRLYEAGCDDATISLQKGAIILAFDREARTLIGAINSAIADIERAGAKVVHVEPDHLVSLSEISVRAGITRAAASNYAKGARGEGFPSPVARVTTDSPLWDWVEVARWFHRRGRLSMNEVVRARVLRSANVAIMARSAGHLGEFGPRKGRPTHRAAA